MNHTSIAIPAPDPELDLVLERIVDLSPEQLYRAWTDPALLLKWFAPVPFTVAECEVKPVPGGEFNVTMRGPDGTMYPGTGCYLALVPNELVVFTDALSAGFRPTAEPFFVGAVSFERVDGGSRYVARAIHGSSENRTRHEKMGFHDGWSQCLDQLVALLQSAER